MIKLLDLLNEYKSVDGLDRFDKSGNNTIFWVDGDVYINPKDFRSLMMQFKAIADIDVDPTKQLVKFRDFDDWSSFKSIQRYQQATKDLVRLKLVDPSYKLEITLTDMKKNLAVRAATIKSFLEYDASFSKVIPRAFHGTTTHELENIKRLGILRPSQTSSEILKWSQFYGDQSPDTVYLTIDFDRAKYYAQHAAQVLKHNYKIKAKPIVIQIDN